MAISIGLIGYGNWAKEAYVPAILHHDNIKIAAVAALSDTTKGLAKEHFGNDVKLFSNPCELIAQDEIDAVMIGLPSELIADVGIVALKAGKHVWMEPCPPGDNRLVKMFQLNTHPTQVCHTDLELRYIPVISTVKKLIAETIGSPLSVRIVLDCDWGRTWPEDMVKGGEMASGLSIWYLDAIDAIFNQWPDSIYVSGARPRFELAIEMGVALLKFGNATGEWSFNFHSLGEFSLLLEIAATNGEAQADLVTGKYRYRSQSSKWVHGTTTPTQPLYGFAGMRECADAFIRAIKTTGTTLTRPEVVKRVHATASGFDNSVKSGMPALIKQL